MFYIFLILAVNFNYCMGDTKDAFTALESNLLDASKNYVVSKDIIDEDTYLNFIQLATKYGYLVEEHKVVTEDDYVLTLYRIHNKETKNAPVIFLMHGILDSADTWILQGPDNALGYLLADKGYDIWLGNSRGNKYSTSHLTLTTDMSEFWDFTWEEIAIYDVTAMIDYALNATGERSLYYIGHSQGTTSFYAMNSLRPEYSDKVKLMFSLSPVAWMEHAKSPIVKIFSPANNILGFLFSNINTKSPSVDFINQLAALVCNIFVKCNSIYQALIGEDRGLITQETWSIVYGHLVSGSSILQFVHYGQLVMSGRFCRFDFGLARNLELYGVENPPDYNVSNVKTPVVLFYSENDWLSDPKDVNTLKSKLPNVYQEYLLHNFNHFDFMYSNYAKEAIYSNVLRQINAFEENQYN